MTAPDASAAWGMYSLVERTLANIARELADDPEEALADTRQRFEDLAPTLAYLDNPSHVMATSVFSCACCLALYLSLRTRGIDEHQVGRAIHREFAKFELPAEALTAKTLDDAARSQTGAAPGEFVFETIGTAGATTWEMNIRSCGICALFSAHDAMELVPYMCALDDLFSDNHAQGLRRTGTIALGATHCDFRYEAGGEPLSLASQHPERIQLSP